MLTRLFEVLRRLETDVDLTYFGVDAGSNKELTGVVGDPDLHFPFLLEESAGSKHGGFDAVAPDITEYGFLTLAGRYTNGNSIDKARVANIEGG